MFDEKFIKEVKHILYLIFKYGIDRTQNVDEMLKFQRRDLCQDFIVKVHTVFMIAQKSILFGLEKESKYKRKLRGRLSEANKNKNKDLSKDIKQKINDAERRESIYRKLADSIAWQMVHLDGTIIRRLYRGVNQMDILNSNIDHDLQTVEKNIQRQQVAISINIRYNIFYPNWRSAK